MYCHTSFWSEVNLPARLAFRLLSRTVPSAQRYPSLVRKPPRASRAVEQPSSEGEGSCSSSSSPKSLSTWAFHCTVTACRLVPRNSWSSSSISSRDVRKIGARKAGARVKAYRDKRGKGGKGGGVPRFAPYRSSRSAGVPLLLLYCTRTFFKVIQRGMGMGSNFQTEKGGRPRISLHCILRTSEILHLWQVYHSRGPSAQNTEKSKGHTYRRVTSVPPNHWRVRLP